MYSFWSNVVSTTIVGGSGWRRICSVAASPSSSGIRMSISTTSGFDERRLTDRLEAVLGLGDDLDVALGLQDHPEAGAHELLVVGDEDPDHPLIVPTRGRAASPP